MQILHIIIIVVCIYWKVGISFTIVIRTELSQMLGFLPCMILPFLIQILDELCYIFQQVLCTLHLKLNETILSHISILYNNCLATKMNVLNLNTIVGRQPSCNQYWESDIDMYIQTDRYSMTCHNTSKPWSRRMSTDKAICR